MVQTFTLPESPNGKSALMWRLADVNFGNTALTIQRIFTSKGSSTSEVTSYWSKVYKLVTRV